MAINGTNYVDKTKFYDMISQMYTHLQIKNEIISYAIEPKEISQSKKTRESILKM